MTQTLYAERATHRMATREKELADYWDHIADKNITRKQDKEGNTRFIVSDNWEKRRNLISFLLEYPIEEADSILEIGPGPGSIIGMLSEIYGAIAINYTSMDTSPIFQKTMRDLRKRPCELGVIHDLPFDDKQFNKVWLFDVLEHVDVDTREQAAKEVSRVLQKNGLIFINNPLSESNHDNEFDFGFSQLDIGKFCDNTKCIIRKVDLHSSFGKLFYQFIVLEKVY